MHGDCLRVLAQLPDGSIDCIVTDPPYCSGAATESQRAAATHTGLRSETMAAGRFKWFSADNMTTAGLVWLLREVAVEADRVLTPNGSLCVFCDSIMAYSLAPAMESGGFRLRTDIIWNKGHFGCGTGFRPQYEKVLHLTRRSTTFNEADTGDVITVPRVPTADRDHPAEKPVELFRKIIRVVSPLGGLVMDPFAGSCASAVASIAEGRRWLGVDKDPGYVESGRSRIREALGDGGLYSPKFMASASLFEMANNDR